MITNKEGQVPTPLIIYTCAAFRHSLMEWEKNGGAPPKARSVNLCFTPRYLDKIGVV